MAEIGFVCPGCRQPIGCEEQYRGRQVKCPKCLAVVTVPDIVLPNGGHILQPPLRFPDIHIPQPPQHMPDIHIPQPG